MANTIRRTPVSFDIPDSPDYKFLNITDFRGIAISDNPFTLSSNTASDMLNLYVDETNTLTTRPRLELYESIKKSHPDMTKFLGLYPLSFGFLLHYIKTDGSYAISLILSSNGTLNYYDVTNGETIEGEKLIVFEQNDNIYILNGSNYYVITYTLESGVLSNINCSIVEGYVPTTKVGGTNLVEGKDYEPYNLLSNKYKHSYFWDGTWDPNKELTRGALDYSDVMKSSAYYFPHTTQSEYFGQDYRPIKYLSRKAMNSETFWEGDEFLVVVTNVTETSGTYVTAGFATVNIQPNTTELQTSFEELELPSNVSSGFSLDCSIDKTLIACLHKSSSSEPYGKLYIKNDNGISVGWGTLQTGTAEDELHNEIFVSDNGSVICSYSDNKLYIHRREGTSYETYSFDLEYPADSYNSKLMCSDDGNVCGVIEGSTYMCVKNVLSVDLSETSAESVLMGTSVTSYAISSSGNILISSDHAGINIFYNFLTETSKTEYPTLLNKRFTGNMIFSKESDNRVYLLFTNDHPSTTGWISFTGDEPFFMEYDYDFDEREQTVYRYLYATDTGIVWTNFLLLDSSHWANELNTRYFTFYSEEPNLYNIITASETSDTWYKESLDKTKLFLQSTLSTRFDNQRWFAVKNTVFRTSNNDPTYIPITNYANLGETDENITGFNLVQDSLMVVYKDNYIWAVSPMTYTDNDVTYYDYNYQETKNTVGNNAIGASIVSAYSELPLQIAYDGIYALSQLTNVYASDRISESISDNIAKKWLQEDRNVIRNAKTINRLYWTYVILSYEKITKVYLLDNRTTSWFYWELPVSVVNAFVKDNVVYMTHTDGTVYTLQTAEIINKYNPDLTEYYDDGEQIINWYWKSQILPLGTINYSKRLIDTTFIFTDTDSTDEYSLDYKFTAYRKVVSQTNATTISNQLNYIQSTTKKTLINRCNFIQLELSNSVDDLNNNKLRLVGLGFKYVLLEGLL